MAAALAAAAVVGAAGSIVSGIGSRDAARAEAKFLDNEAQQVFRVAFRETRDEVKQTDRDLARARAVFAASGVSTTGTNASSFLAAVRTESNIRKSRIKRDAEFTSRQLQLRAKATRKAGQNAMMAGFLGAAGTGIKFGGQVLGRKPTGGSGSEG